MRGRARVTRPPAAHRPRRSGSRAGERPYPGQAPHGTATHRTDRLPSGPGHGTGGGPGGGTGGGTKRGPDGAAPVPHRSGTCDRRRPARMRPARMRGARMRGARIRVARIPVARMRVRARGIRPPAARPGAELLSRGTAHEGSEHS
ncbi:hypothetical protein GCM10023220_06410 [Streptomyces ziwulingensis]|uniref:Uncharacterized protein n=1 Tax=Streptomyces ziwulingensis TaxID=1045501 RepID=A0ABP9ASY8_9ACTN